MSLKLDRWIKRVRNWTAGSSESGTESGTGQLDQASLELERWIERVWNWTGELTESGTGQVDQASLELDRWIE